MAGNFKSLFGCFLLIRVNHWTDVDAFCSSKPAAVCKNGKWAFIDTAGNLMTDYIYDGAHSFCNGFAAVKKGDLWGFITEDFSIAVDYSFCGAAYFNSNGSVFVKTSNNGGWDMIFILSMK